MPVGNTYWVEKGMLGTVLENICPAENPDGDYVRFAIKSSFIHAIHPLGFIRKLEVSIDGQKIDIDDTFFVLRKNWVPIRYLSTISDIWWKMGEYAYIYIRCPEKMTTGEHYVCCEMEFSTLFHTRTVDYNELTDHMSMSLKGRLKTPGGGAS